MKYNLQFDEEHHIYTVDGVEVPSVTEIVQFLSVGTAAAASPWQRNMAAALGTRVHQATVLYDYIGLDLDMYDYDVFPYIRGYSDFVRDYRINGYILTEQRITNGDYAGTLDRLGMIDGKLTVIDFKTGTTIDPRKEAAQLYGYAKILADNGFLGKDFFYDFRGMIVRLSKDGKYKAVERNLYCGKLFFEKCRDVDSLIKEDKKHGRTGIVNS